MKSTSIALGTAIVMGTAAFGVVTATATAAKAATEQPKYKVVDRIQDDIEVRRYGARTVAEVEIVASGDRNARRQAFRILAGYIFGKNRTRAKIAMTAPVETQRSSEKIAMTAPVETQTSGGTFRMAFFLPAKYSVRTAPKPLDPRIRIRTAAPVLIATYRFSGVASESDTKRRWLILKGKLSETKWQVVGKPVSYFYNPPWTLPMFRRNEVAITVKIR